MSDLTLIDDTQRRGIHSKVLTIWSNKVRRTGKEMQKKYRCAMTQYNAWLLEKRLPVCDKTFLEFTEKQAYQFFCWLEQRPGNSSRRERLKQRRNRRALEKKGKVEKPKISAATLSKHVECIRALYEELIEEELIQRNPFQSRRIKVKKDNVKKVDHQPMTVEQVKAMIAAYPAGSLINIRRQTMIAFLFYTGCRIGEMRKLKVRDVVLDGPKPRVSFRETKTGEDRTLPIHPNLLVMLQRYWKRRGVSYNGHDEFFFISNKFTGIPSTVILKDFKRACAKIGLEPELWSPHSARVTAVTLAYEAGASFKQIMAMTGHKSLDVLMIYLKPIIELEDNAAMQLPY